MKNYLTLQEIPPYVRSFRLANYVWNIVILWDYFAKETIGKQFMKSIDSISANIAEGFGKYTKKDKIHYYRISFGSVTESLDWNQKAKIRKLLKDNEYIHIFGELKELPKEINTHIKHTNNILKI